MYQLETVEAVPELHGKVLRLSPFFCLHKPIDLRFDKTRTALSPYSVVLSIIIGLQPNSRFTGVRGKDIHTGAHIISGHKFSVFLFVCLSNSDYRR